VRRAHVDVDAVASAAFALTEDHGPFASEWHAHRKHQLLYAAKGTLALSVEGQRWILPPQRAAWIRAGTQHAVATKTGIALRTIYLSPSLVREPPSGVKVFAVTALAREMILHAMRWGPDAKTDGTREAFFRALAALVVEWMESERPLFLPAARTEELARALRWVDENLAVAAVDGAAAAAHVSVRTLSRRFEEELSTSFRAYLQTARILRALELLARPRASVTTTAYAVGFRSVAAFTTAFRAQSGETPSEYRARVTR
jgi:AraC-like DNA-binding protein